MNNLHFLEEIKKIGECDVNDVNPIFEILIKK